jgi:uncharacterized protein
VFNILLAAAIASSAQSLPAEQEVRAAGPQGPLAGTLLVAGPKAPLVLIIPCSGPTDRDGNSPLGVKAAPYWLLAEALARRHVSSLRIDKRGMFGSKAAIPDANKVTIADYAADVHSWAREARRITGAKCIWVTGHSEGGMVALVAGQQPNDLCGVITISAAGRPVGEVMRDQLRSNPANAPILEPAMHAIDEIEAGRSVDAASLPAPLQPLFNSAVQPFERDLFSYDPTRLVASLKVPLLIVQGNRDIQVSVADAEALHRAQPSSVLRVIPNANHVLKTVASDDRAANVATYADPTLPLAPGIADAIVDFIRSEK